MADHLFDELDRWEVDLLDDVSYDGIRNSLIAWTGGAVTHRQAEVAREYVRVQQELAKSLGFSISTTRVREGRQTVERTVLRNSRGQFIARGGRRIKTFLDEAGF